jgi:hypothetical protein
MSNNAQPHARHHRRARARILDSVRFLKLLQVIYPSRLCGGGPGPAAGYLGKLRPCSGLPVVRVISSFGAHACMQPRAFRRLNDGAAAVRMLTYERSERMVSS